MTRIVKLTSKSLSGLFLAGSCAGLLWAGAALAGDLPRLPQPVVLQQGTDSPGVVKFDHATHVDSAKPSCTGCHPGQFGILGRSAEQKPKAVTHARMESGEACGACHGKKAFAFEDCTMCHAQ
jgi:c(7)-type cytochrome triheme protein